ncbi:MAG: acyltransferase family protein, partial [Actinomycetes bacterium]
MSTSTAPAALLAPTTGPSRTLLRTDVQGLRALAVSLVFVYHLWPGRIPGGYIGVDVFFVISGFLITSHLLAHPPRSLPDLSAFWSRRARRLLPASLLVLAVTLVASRLVAPETEWAGTARQAGGAAVYVVNWLLAADSVDYLASENAPSPVQHFWSLSVEEQFYFVWPVLILGLVAWAVRRQWRPQTVIRVGLGAVVLVSLAYSVYATAVSPDRAYFVTPTRAWEFGVGGLLAAVLPLVGGTDRGGPVPLPRPVRSGMAWLGLAAIAAAAVGYSAATPFPGWQAALPVLGTAAVIAAMPAGRARGVDRMLAQPWVQWLGDRSYSIYLWHWPLIVLMPALLGRDLGIFDEVNVVLATLLLATLTKRFVEDPFRTAVWARPPRRVFAAAAAGMAVVLLLAL